MTFFYELKNDIRKTYKIYCIHNVFREFCRKKKRIRNNLKQEIIVVKSTR